MHESVISQPRLVVKQIFEFAEVFTFETRNKYRITDEGGRDIAYAAEQQKGFLGILLRQFLGHWRTFDIHFFGVDRQPFMTAHHPFRWFFQRLEVRGKSGRYLGAVERRWSIIHKKFHVENAHGQTAMEVYSPIWRPWTFPFIRHGRECARILKKWSGIGYELFTDRDSFLVEFPDPGLSPEDKSLILAASIYIDLLFFENKGGGPVDLIDFST